MFTFHLARTGQPFIVLNLHHISAMEAIGEKQIKVWYKYGMVEEYLLTNATETAWDILAAYGNPVIS